LLELPAEEFAGARSLLSLRWIVHPRKWKERENPSLDRRKQTQRLMNPVVRQICKLLNLVPVTMLQASPHAIHFKRIFNFGEGQAQIGGLP
jgi:hypothetical protein